MTFYRETPCEHGGMSPHVFEFYIQDRGLETALAECPGGSRGVVTIDYEAAIEGLIGAFDIPPISAKIFAHYCVNSALGITEDE